MEWYWIVLIAIVAFVLGAMAFLYWFLKGWGK